MEISSARRAPPPQRTQLERELAARQKEYETLQRELEEALKEAKQGEEDESPEPDS